MSTWVTPKTNWISSDYFNITDYTRIVGNLKYLKKWVDKLFSEVTIESMVDTKTYSSMIYAEEINAIEHNLQSLNLGSYSFDIGSGKTWYVNEPTPTYEDFNRIESATLKIYEHLMAQYQCKRKLSFRLGSGNQRRVARV